MKRIFRKALSAARLALVAFALLVLALNGAASAHRLFTGYQPEPPDRLSSDPARIVPGPPGPDDTAVNMTPTGRPNAEPAAFLTSAPMVGPDSNPARDKLTPHLVNFDGLTAGTSRHRAAVVSTPSLVSSQMALQFTLVGAKPSGTS
ncbi:MAG: hypothetical protein JSW34_09470 [Candidatus Zixiibacteriota bacterium]|nr:MAG: hypothetical protein JSW34_09470 [candidate division Zixibacteria bacterium]